MVNDELYDIVEVTDAEAQDQTVTRHVYENTTNHSDEQNVENLSTSSAAFDSSIVYIINSEHADHLGASNDVEAKQFAETAWYNCGNWSQIKRYYANTQIIIIHDQFFALPCGRLVRTGQLTLKWISRDIDVTDWTYLTTFTSQQYCNSSASSTQAQEPF